METVLRPPDYEPGAVGTYKITHSCVMDDEQIFHMELQGESHSWHPTLGFLNNRLLVPFDASAVVHNTLGYTPDATGTYRIGRMDDIDRTCLIDVGATIGHRMWMKWRTDKLATERVYKWQPWP